MTSLPRAAASPMGQPDPLLAGWQCWCWGAQPATPATSSAPQALNPGQSHAALPGMHSPQGGLQPSGRAVLDQAQDRVSLLLSRGQEPTAQHLLSADKRINLVTNNRAIKPFIWLAFCCQLLGKSCTQRTSKAVCSHLCHLPHSSVLACRHSQAVWLGRHQAGDRSRSGSDREVKTPGDTVSSRGCPYAHCGEAGEGSAHPQQVHTVPLIPPHRAGAIHVALQTAHMNYRCWSREP